ncbi:MAG: hypothetical protein NZ958_04825 [Bacteroidia bacterium]|nr:hypothetical protein [Bacteroidia bacterium]MDW8088918.1 hypothetical protein [Bacteroidia bacterium]
MWHRAKVGILGLSLLWAQEEVYTRLIFYEELLDRYFRIHAWSKDVFTTRPDTVIFLQVSERLPELRRFSRLEGLFLSDLDEVDLPQLVGQLRAYCPKLRILALENCDIQDPRPLTTLKLEGLLLDGNPISDFSSLNELRTLQFFSAARTPLQAIDFLANLPKLQALDLSETPIKDLRPLAALPSPLRMISLFRCNGISDFSPLLRHTGLEYLNLSHTAPAAARPLLLELHRFPTLRVLQAQNLIYDSAVLERISQLVHLEELTIGQNPFITRLDFVRPLQRLLYLDVHRCNIQNLEPLADLPNLVKLSIGKNRITQLAPLVRCVRLSYLYCYENPITDWEKLLELPALSYVMISRRDLPPERLSALKAKLLRKGVKLEAM